jgi:hypothetical protein
MVAAAAKTTEDISPEGRRTHPPRRGRCQPSGAESTIDAMLSISPMVVAASRAGVTASIGLHKEGQVARRKALKKAVAKRKVKKAVAKRALKKRAVKKAVAKRALKKRAVKRAVAKRALKKRAVKKAVAKRALKKRALKRALVKRALRRAIVARAIEQQGMGE